MSHSRSSAVKALSMKLRGRGYASHKGVLFQFHMIPIVPRIAAHGRNGCHHIDIIMTTLASQITSITVVYSTVYSDADQNKHQSSASLAFVWGIHRGRWIPRTKASYAEMFPFDDVMLLPAHDWHFLCQPLQKEISIWQETVSPTINWKVSHPHSSAVTALGM